MKCCTCLAVLLTVLAGCSNDETLAIAASSGQFTPAQLQTASVNMRTSEALQKATTPAEKVAIMAKHWCELPWEYRREQWLGEIGREAPAEHAAYMRSDPVAREQYWKGTSKRLGCTF
jgi:hypothetical protein